MNQKKMNKKKLHVMFVLVNIDQQKKVINNICYVSENSILSNLNLTEFF